MPAPQYNVVPQVSQESVDRKKTVLDEVDKRSKKLKYTSYFVGGLVTTMFVGSMIFHLAKKWHHGGHHGHDNRHGGHLELP